MMLTLNFALLTWIVVQHARSTRERHRLAESRAMQLRLADRVYAAHEVLGRRAERKENMRVECEVEETQLEGTFRPVDGIIVTCSRCGETAEVFGCGERSIKRGLMMLRESCPQGENNFYVSE